MYVLGILIFLVAGAINNFLQCLEEGVIFHRSDEKSISYLSPDGHKEQRLMLHCSYFSFFPLDLTTQKRLSWQGRVAVCQILSSFSIMNIVLYFYIF